VVSQRDYEIVNNELFLAYSSVTPFTLCEVCIITSEDRPGLLAAISNVFADNGINILNVSVNALEHSFYFVVDLTRCMTSIEDVIDKLRSFSFVKDVFYRYMRASPVVLPRFIRPTFRGKSVVVLDKDLLQELAKDELSSLVKVAYYMGRSDARFVKNYFSINDPIIEDLLEISKTLQLRGLCKIDSIKMEDCSRIVTKLTDCIDPNIVTEYLRGIVDELYGRKYRYNMEARCIDEHTLHIEIMFSSS